MPNLKSAKKRVRIEAKRRARNSSIKSLTRTFITKARNAIADDAATPETETAVREALSRLDRAVTKGVIHRNNAARRKSRLMARLHKMQVEQAQPAKPTAASKARVTRSSKAKPKAGAES